jgi:hypothetical protein
MGLPKARNAACQPQDKSHTISYQIRQFLRLIERYNLKLEDDE